MCGLSWSAAGALGTKLWGARPRPTVADLPEFQADLLADPALSTALAGAKTLLDDAEKTKRDLLRCDSPEPDQACDVAVRYLAQTTRTPTAQNVYAQFV